MKREEGRKVTWELKKGSLERVGRRQHGERGRKATWEWKEGSLKREEGRQHENIKKVRWREKKERRQRENGRRPYEEWSGVGEGNMHFVCRQIHLKLEV